MAKTFGAVKQTRATRVFNIDAVKLVPDQVLEDVEKVLSGDRFDLDKEYFGLRSKMWDRQSSYFEMIHSWPIPYKFSGDILREPEVMASLMLLLLKVIPVVSKRPPKGGDDPDDELNKCVGQYFSDRNYRFYAGRPHIELYPDRILQFAGGSESAFLRNCTTTLVHELAHALMDPCNFGGDEHLRATYESELYCFSWNETDSAGMTVRKYSNFYKIREESFADCIMYKVFKSSGQSTRNKYKPSELEKEIESKDFEYSIARYWFKDRPNITGWMNSKCFDKDVISVADARNWMKDVYDAWSKKSRYYSETNRDLPWL